MYRYIELKHFISIKLIELNDENKGDLVKIVKHGYNNEPTEDEMRIIIKFQENVLSMELMDKGKPVVPSNIKPRNLDDIKSGGLGTFFIGQIMDEVVFKTTKVNWVNHLILTKAF